MSGPKKSALGTLTVQCEVSWAIASVHGCEAMCFDVHKSCDITIGLKSTWETAADVDE
jgi:hypothetical protein